MQRAHSLAQRAPERDPYNAKLANETMAVATIYLPIRIPTKPSLAIDDPPPLKPRPKSVHETPHYQLRDNGVVPPLPTQFKPPTKINEKSARDGLGRSLSRRWSSTIRRSWGNRLSWQFPASKTDDDEEEEEQSVVWTEDTKKLTKVSRQRDWSDELDEDDVDVNCRYRRKGRDRRIIWADKPSDIGRYWHYISKSDD